MTHQQQTAFEDIVGKEEIARKEQFLLFPRFLLNQKIVSPFINIVDIIFLFATELEEPKIGISGKGLKHGIVWLTPNDKILDQFNSKAFPDDILDVVQIMICVSDMVENIVGKGENAGYQHFLLFP